MSSTLEAYQRHLYLLRQKRSGQALTFRSQYSRLVPVRAFFKWLTRQNVIASNPASELVLPKLERRLPAVLTVAEVEQVLSLPDIAEPLGLRDRAMMEVLYSTGVRRMPPDEGALFLGQLGGPLGKNHLTRLFRRYVLAAELGKVGSCHLFRHTMAPAMLEHGADIRFIQQMLGHRDISSTQRYSQVSTTQLKRVHALTHPAASLPRRKPDHAKPGDQDDTTELDELLGDLTAERDDN